jgi:multisubunit Na+/H+ antiporter MnhE subunit
VIDHREDRTNVWFSRLLLLIAVFALCWQARSLYIYPIPDSAYYWYGDESWVMMEARTQMSEGVLRHPYAYGATLNDHAGILLGDCWGTSLLYGSPAMIFSQSFPVIAIGRAVTFSLALFSIFAIFFVAIRLGASRISAGLGSIILATCPAFTITSHSARSDLLVGLVVMLIVAYFANESTSTKQRSSRWWFCFGLCMTFAAFLFAVHLITLLLPLAVYLLFRLGAFRNFKFLSMAVLGASAAAATLVLSYFLLAHDLSLFGTTGQHVQFADVAAQKPIMRLFSRSVQWNNLLQRFGLLWTGATALLILAAHVVVKLLIDVLRKRAAYLNDPVFRALIALTLVVALSWLLLQGSIIYYVPHFLILAVLVVVVAADRVLFRQPSPRVSKLIVGIATIILVVVHVMQTNSTVAASRLFSDENRRGIAKLQARIHSEMGSSNKRPIVLAESPAAYGLELDTSISLMSPLFPAFPKYDEPITATLARYHVRYAMLYDAKQLHDNIAGIPTLTDYIESHGTLIDTAIGVMFDMKRSYVHPDLSTPDTMKLYRLDEH